MIQETITYTCRSCGSANIIKNGSNRCGNPQHHCKSCGAYRVLKPKKQHDEHTRQQVLRADQERLSLQAIERNSTYEGIFPEGQHPAKDKYNSPN